MTQDLDVTLATPLHGYAAGLGSLPGWLPDRIMEHRWHAPGDVRVDIVPADAHLSCGKGSSSGRSAVGGDVGDLLYFLRMLEQ